jgi:Fic family protein
MLIELVIGYYPGKRLCIHSFVLFISYIQPFEDGNKRTGRITGNGILIENGYCPLSYRSVKPVDYKKAMILFYEQNNLAAYKKLFIEQFAFAVNKYFR